jgi:hypothetical protein
MGLMKEEFIKQREEEVYQDETIKLHYEHLLLLSEQEEETKEVINTIKEK